MDPPPAVLDQLFCLPAPSSIETKLVPLLEDYVRWEILHGLLEMGDKWLTPLDIFKTWERCGLARIPRGGMGSDPSKRTVINPNLLRPTKDQFMCFFVDSRLGTRAWEAWENSKETRIFHVLRAGGDPERRS
ncbi:hypothetical protein FQN50_008542 [Emmonsiellopsis sp. PD_5]|nr:hypothetical protein FQN50_008542 [Emmonsiellopsis sp. PD_5]